MCVRVWKTHVIDTEIDLVVEEELADVREVVGGERAVREGLPCRVHFGVDVSCAARVVAWENGCEIGDVNVWVLVKNEWKEDVEWNGIGLRTCELSDTILISGPCATQKRLSKIGSGKRTEQPGSLASDLRLLVDEMWGGDGVACVACMTDDK